MKMLPNKLALLGAVLASMFAVACGQGGGGQQSSSMIPRRQSRSTIARASCTPSRWKMGQLRAMATGDAPVDETQFKKAANDLVALAGMITEGFVPE